MASFTKFIEEIPALQEYFNTFSKKLMILCLQVTTHPAIAIEAFIENFDLLSDSVKLQDFHRKVTRPSC